MVDAVAVVNGNRRSVDPLLRHPLYPLWLREVLYSSCKVAAKRGRRSAPVLAEFLPVPTPPFVQDPIHWVLQRVNPRRLYR